MEDFKQSSLRLHQDADRLLAVQRYATASHLFGLAAECAIKSFLLAQPGVSKLPFKHLPNLLDDAKRQLGGRGRSHFLSVLSAESYMAGWDIANRYWPNHHFTAEQSKKFRQDSYSVLKCIHPV